MFDKSDRVRDAWTSGDISKMLAVLNKPCDLVDRHFLLQSIVRETYRQRANPKMRAICLDVARRHLGEFGRISIAVKQDDRKLGGKGELPTVLTFSHLATVLMEDGNYDEAIQVCEAGIRYDVCDGTKSGLAGRLERIRKKQQASAKKGKSTHKNAAMSLKAGSGSVKFDAAISADANNLPQKPSFLQRLAFWIRHY
jgi:hypothetical protein